MGQEINSLIQIVVLRRAVLLQIFAPLYLFDRKKYEGSNYQDGTTGDDKNDNAVAPGMQFKYVWQVPERAGPTPNEDDCLAWAYFSDAHAVTDFYTGLVGPLLVCKKVYSDPTMRIMTLNQSAKLKLQF